jgi:hypothetical protein
MEAQPMEEHAVLLRAYARAQERCSRLLAERAAQIEELEAQIVRLRGALVARDSAIAVVREELAARAPKGMTLPKRLQALLLGRPPRRSVAASVATTLPPADLREKAVLCVGRQDETPSLARQLVEIAGGRYLHHDGGDDADVAALDAGLRAADLVICQTGCVSHGAYWRVQDHCRRTGKPCVLVGEPQPVHFVRRGAGVALAQAATSSAGWDQ